MSGDATRGRHRVCRSSELAPGAMRCVVIDGRPVLVANVAGQIYAVDDTCTHEDASLSTGVLEHGHVRCPLHGSRFCLRTGAPLEEPADEPLRCYATHVQDDQVFVVVDAGGAQVQG